MTNPQAIVAALRAGRVPVAVERPPPTRAIRGGVRPIPAAPPRKPLDEPTIALARATKAFWSQVTNAASTYNTWKGRHHGHH